MTTAPRMDGPAWAMLLLLSMLWGGSFLFTEVILGELPVLTTVAARLAIASATLWLVVAATGAAVPRTASAWRGLAFLSLTNNILPFTLIVWGQTHLTGGLAAVLNATTPIFTGLLAGLVLADERLTAQRMLGLVLGLVGVGVVIGPTAFTALGADILAELAVLGAAMGYAVSTVYARTMARHGIAPEMLAAGQITISAVVMVGVALAVDHPWTLPVPSTPVALALLGFGSLSTGLAYILFFKILQRAGTNVVLVTVLVPVFAILAGAALLGEPVALRQVGGMALIGFALSVIDGRLWRRLQPGASRRA